MTRRRFAVNLLLFLSRSGFVPLTSCSADESKAGPLRENTDQHSSGEGRPLELAFVFVGRGLCI